MKKKYYVIFLFLFITQIILSQNFRYGIKGGVNYCDLNGPDKPASLDQDLGFSGGFYLDSRVSEFLSSQIELNFTRYNFHFNENIDIVDNRVLYVEEQNDYITFPALLRYKRGYEFIFAYINIGLQGSVLINSYRNTTLYINDLLVDPEYYYGYQNTRFDYGLLAGIGIQFKPINIDLRYYMSTKNLYTINNSREIRYETISLEIGYQFNYKPATVFGRKSGWKGLKYKIKKIFK